MNIHKFFTNDVNFLIDFSAVASKETDLEMPVTADESDPHVYKNLNILHF